MEFTIKLKNCAFFAHHGIHTEEQTLGQRFFVDAAIKIESGEGIANDSVKDTVDYDAAFALIKEVVTNTRRYLIETLALDIARELLASFNIIQSVSITVRKPSAPVQGILDYAEAMVEQSRN